MADRESALIEQSHLPDANPIQGKDNSHSNSQLDPSHLNDKDIFLINHLSPYRCYWNRYANIQYII